MLNNFTHYNNIYRIKVFSLLACLLVINIIYAQEQEFEFYHTFYSEPNDFFVSDDTVYTSSSNSVAKLINGSWQNITPVAFPEPGNYYNTTTIEIVAENHIYAAAKSSGQVALFRVWNGINWENVGALPSYIHEITDIHYVSGNEIYITAENAYLEQYVLKFDGTNWESLNLPQPGPYFSKKIHYVSNQEIYVSGRGGETMVYDGTSWEAITESLSVLPYSKWVHIEDEDHKYHTGFSQLKNFASGTLVDVGDLYQDEYDIQGVVDFMVVLSPNDLYVSVRRYIGYSDAFFVSHWDGNQWTRLWTYDSSQDISDYLTFFGLSNNHIYAKIINSSLYRYESETMNLDTIVKEENIKVFPNPTDSSISIVSNTSLKEITVFDSFGKMLFQNDSTKELNLIEYPKGVYFIKITSQNNGVEWRKIIKK